MYTNFIGGFNNLEDGIDLDYFTRSDDNFFTLKVCYKCSFICNNQNSKYIDNQNICNTCYKKDLLAKKINKRNKDLGNVSYIDCNGKKHLGKILYNDHIYYDDKTYDTTITWIKFIDEANK